MSEAESSAQLKVFSRLWTLGGMILLLGLLVNFWQPTNGGVAPSPSPLLHGPNSPVPHPHASPLLSPEQNGMRVNVIRPRLNTAPRTNILPCFATWHDITELHARASGFLSQQQVDIGDRVKSGEILAQIVAPELDQDVEIAEVTLVHREAAVKQNLARLKTAIAEKRAMEAAREKSKTDVVRWLAEKTFREKEFSRFEQLKSAETIQPAIVDEKKYQLESARAALLAAETMVQSAEENVLASLARVELAEADLNVARVQTNFAQAELEKKKLLASFRKVSSPFDGVITARNYYRGEFIRAADQGGSKPLLVVGRTDLIRVVVYVPDRDVPFIHVGNGVKIEFDALPEKTFLGTISRVALSQDSITRTMRAEVDLLNTEKLIVDQMYGRMTIELEQGGNCLFVPSTCLVGKLEKNQGTVFVVQDRIARLRPISVGRHDGISLEVLHGLSGDENVISLPPGSLKDGMPVLQAPLSLQNQFIVAQGWAEGWTY